MSERKAFSKKADELGEILNKLRPGTGAAVTWLLCEAYAEGAKEMREKAAQECEILHKVHPRESGREPNCAGLIRALPLSGAEESKKENA